MLWSLDVSSAYLHSDLAEVIYVRQPIGFEVPNSDGMACLCHKALYGLRQSGRAWYFEFKSTLLAIGFTIVVSDPCVYYRSKDGQHTAIVTHVDDCQGLSSSTKERDAVHHELAKRYKYTVKPDPSRFLILGILVEKLADGSRKLSMPHYIDDLLNRFQLSDSPPLSTPLNTNVELSVDKVSTHTNSDVETDSVARSPSYAAAVGGLMWPACTVRPDISFAVQLVARFTNNPTKEHWTAVIRILRYLKGTRTRGLVYSPSTATSLAGFCDADWAGDVDKRKSTSGYCFLLNGTAISWTSKRQSTVALSSAEAEYLALGTAVQEALWLHSFTSELHILRNPTIPIFCDNTAAIALANNPIFHGRSKHIDIRHHFIRSHLQEQHFSLSHIPGNENPADIFTKGLPRPAHEKLCLLLGLRD